jgi:hypothetical protein
MGDFRKIDLYPELSSQVDPNAKRIIMVGNSSLSVHEVFPLGNGHIGGMIFYVVLRKKSR